MQLLINIKENKYEERINMKVNKVNKIMKENK